MKKLVSILSSAILSIFISTPNIFAIDAEYVPKLYFRAEKSDNYKTYEDGNVVIFRSELESNNNVVKASVYIDDESLSCWYVSPKWKCESEYAKLENLIDPLPMSDDAPNIAYAYAEKNDEGEFTHVRHGTIISTDTRYNTMAFTCQVTSYMDRSAMKPYGDKSDSYPLTSFDINFASDSPSDDYIVYFLTKPEDYDDQRTSDVAMRTDEGSIVKQPETKSITITVTDKKFGDITGDGKVDSNDASAILVAYSKSSTGLDHGLTNEEFHCGDSDLNCQLTSSDASNILSYYSYLSTTDEPINLTKYMNRK